MAPPSSLVLRRILHLEPKNRSKVSIQIEKEILIAMKVQGLNLHDTTNLALEQLLRSRNISLSTSADLPAKVRA